jgi:hypothetical protein
MSLISPIGKAASLHTLESIIYVFVKIFYKKISFAYSAPLPLNLEGRGFFLLWYHA